MKYGTVIGKGSTEKKVLGLYEDDLILKEEAFIESRRMNGVKKIPRNLI